MKIIIIESRGNVHIWDRVFQNGLGHSVEAHFLIFNPHFSAEHGLNHLVSKNNREADGVEVPVEFDRQRNYFESTKTNHYGPYFFEISKLIGEIDPDLVIGESASFQDYLAIQVCREKKITYLNPMSSRYPYHRFAFYLEDTLVPYLGSRESLEKDNLAKVFETIVDWVAVPDYMTKKNYKFSPLKRFGDLKTKLFSFLKSDSNTPSPIQFLSRTYGLKKIKAYWSKNAISLIKDERRFKVLYPMQMQPESNIDVYGAPFNDQLEIVKQISSYLDSEKDVLYVKPNPKPFMEISNELVDFSNTSEHVQLLAFDSSMNEVFPKMDLIVTVTGTVSIEAILANKPIGVFKKTYFNHTKNCFQMTDFEDLKTLLDSVKKGNFKKLDKEERLKHLNFLNKISYEGRISAVNLRPDEVAQIQESFKLFLDQFKRGRII